VRILFRTLSLNVPGTLLVTLLSLGICSSQTQYCPVIVRDKPSKNHYSFNHQILLVLFILYDVLFSKWVVVFLVYPIKACMGYFWYSWRLYYLDYGLMKKRRCSIWCTSISVKYGRNKFYFQSFVGINDNFTVSEQFIFTKVHRWRYLEVRTKRRQLEKIGNYSIKNQRNRYASTDSPLLSSLFILCVSSKLAGPKLRTH
jgi:hypothetical protein